MKILWLQRKWWSSETTSSIVTKWCIFDLEPRLASYFFSSSHEAFFPFAAYECDWCSRICLCMHLGGGGWVGRHVQMRAPPNKTTNHSNSGKLSLFLSVQIWVKNKREKIIKGEFAGKCFHFNRFIRFLSPVNKIPYVKPSEIFIIWIENAAFNHTWISVRSPYPIEKQRRTDVIISLCDGEKEPNKPANRKNYKQTFRRSAYKSFCFSFHLVQFSSVWFGLVWFGLVRFVRLYLLQSMCGWMQSRCLFKWKVAVIHSNPMSA